MPEIYGYTDIGGFSGVYSEASGAFHSTIVTPNTTVATVASADTHLEVVDFMASRYNSIYGKSTTVQPPAYVVYMWQRIA